MPRVSWSIATAGTVVVVVEVVVVVLAVTVAFAVDAVAGMVVVAPTAKLFLLTTGANVVAIAMVVVTICVLMMGRCFTMVVFKLAFPWNTARIFLASGVSGVGTMTEASSMTWPTPGIV